MPLPTDAPSRADLAFLLQACLKGTSSSRAALFLSEAPGFPAGVTARGFRCGEGLGRLLGAKDNDALGAKLALLARGKRTGTRGGRLVVPVGAGRVRGGFLALFKSGGRGFSPGDREIAREAARSMARCLALRAKLAAFQKNYLNTILALLKTIEGKDSFSRGHSSRVAEYCCRAGGSLGLSGKRLETLRWAATFHDIGKIGIVDAILQKKERLDASEMAIVREHPVIGQRIVQDLDVLREASRIIRAHHERVDGKGYPDGLAGDEIPLPARILALAEAFDTITSDTPYKPGRPVEVAARELRKGKGRQFDAELVDPFLEAVLF